MSDKQLLQRFDAWRAEHRTLVLATVVGTAGSTYTKAGHRILITDTGDYQGLISGGCLEGDLAEHARDVLATGAARVVTYDMRGENDELFGLGIGCDGLLRILLQRLSPDSAYEPFAAIAAVLRGDEAAECAIVFAGHEGLGTGTTLLGPGATAEFPGASVLRRTLRPLPRLLLLGAGPDAVPLVALADLLGWRITLVDHRPAYLQRAGFAPVDTALCLPASELAGRVKLATCAAAVVMSHHLATDREYLAALASSPIPYIGLLGPLGRRDRLLRELGDRARGLEGRLRGPAGLDIGADSPASIALSIMAEVHSMTRRRP